MYIRLALVASLISFCLYSYCQDDNEVVFSVNKTADIVPVKTFFYQKTAGAWRDTAFSNILTITGDSFSLYSYTKSNSKGNVTPDSMAKRLLFTGKFDFKSDTTTLSRQSSIKKSDSLFIKQKYKSLAVNFSWIDFFNCVDTPTKQTAIYLNDTADIKIGANTYTCIHIVYGRKVSVRNELRVKIKGRKWYAPGFHEETIPTHVYLRKTDFAPVKIIELPASRQPYVNDQPNWYTTLWFLKQTIE